MHQVQWRGTPWLRPVVFVIANGALVLLILGIVVIPISDFFSARDRQIAEQMSFLARLNAIAAKEPSVQEVAKQTEAQFKRGEFLIGPNEGAINADLQTRVKMMAERTGARLRSVQALPSKTMDQIKFAGARLEIQGPLGAIHQTIYAIESGTPYLFITAAVLKQSPPVNRNGNEEPIIEARLEVFAAVEVEERVR
ncbi:MAG TPA: type II secretion system protein GspM [Xanthobacteraceae bacterium]